MHTSARFSDVDLGIDLDRIDRAGLRLVFTILAIGLIVAFAGCCNPVALEHAEDRVELNAEYMKRESLPSEARKIGQLNHDAWAVMVEMLGGDKPDAETQARIDAAKPKPEEAPDGE